MRLFGHQNDKTLTELTFSLVTLLPINSYQQKFDYFIYQNTYIINRIRLRYYLLQHSYIVKVATVDRRWHKEKAR